MSQNRPSTPRSPIKLNSKVHKSNKSYQNSPPVEGTSSKYSENLTAVSQRSDGDYELKTHDFHGYNSPRIGDEEELK